MSLQEILDTLSELEEYVFYTKLKTDEDRDVWDQLDSDLRQAMDNLHDYIKKSA